MKSLSQTRAVIIYSERLISFINVCNRYPVVTKRTFVGESSGKSRGEYRNYDNSNRDNYKDYDEGGRGENKGSNQSAEKFRRKLYPGHSDYDPDRITRSNCGYFEGDNIYGIDSVRCAMLAGKREGIKELIVQQGITEEGNKRCKNIAKEIIKIATDKGIAINEYVKHDLNMLVDHQPHEGFILRAKPLECNKITNLEKSDNFKCVLLLDEIYDTHNFGALLLTCKYLGVEKVVINERNSAPLSTAVSAASRGALEYMEVCYTSNMGKFIDQSTENGWQVK